MPVSSVHIPFAPKEFAAVNLRREGYEKALEEGGIALDPKLDLADISARAAANHGSGSCSIRADVFH
jgi:hypothetical protein